MSVGLPGERRIYPLGESVFRVWVNQPTAGAEYFKSGRRAEPTGRNGFRAVTHIPMGVVESIVTLAQDDGPGRRAGDRLLRSGAGTPPAPALTPSPALAPPLAETPPALSPRVGSGQVPAGRRSARKSR